MPPALDDCRSLLLIDDEPAIRRMMSLDLSSDGYEVICAEDGERGIGLFESHKPDLVVTDLKMPGKDGIEVLKHIKQKSPETEVIVITGHGDLDLAIKALQLRASDFITKPINGAALEVALDRAAERLRLNRKLRSYTEELEQKVEEATRKALAAQQLAVVGQTVAGLVHSLKNMLSGLRGGLYLVEQHQKSGDPGQLDSGIAMLGRNLERVKSLASNLLSVSKPREPELIEIAAAELIEDALECARQEAENKGVRLLHDPPPAGASLRLDRAMILDALDNLILNAIDAASEVQHGAVNVSLELGRKEAVFVIRDNGPGLSPEAEEHIFEIFYSSKGAQGTGLGLVAARKIAQEHGGGLEFENGPETGATFRLRLPMETK